MSGIEDVLERLVIDPAFAAQLQADPAHALSGYALDGADLEVLAARLSAEPGASGGTERRTSKSTLVGLLDAFGGLAAEGPGDRGGGSDAGDASTGKSDTDSPGARGGLADAHDTDAAGSAGYDTPELEKIAFSYGPWASGATASGADDLGGPGPRTQPGHPMMDDPLDMSVKGGSDPEPDSLAADITVDPDGKEEHYYTVELDNANVASGDGVVDAADFQVWQRGDS